MSWPTPLSIDSIVPFLQYLTRVGYRILQGAFIISPQLFIIGGHRESQSSSFGPISEGFVELGKLFPTSNRHTLTLFEMQARKMESRKHCLWCCHIALSIWSGIFHLFFIFTFKSFTVTWVHLPRAKGLEPFHYMRLSLGIRVFSCIII